MPCVDNEGKIHGKSVLANRRRHGHEPAQHSAALGLGGVTLVLIALLSIAAGFQAALEGSGSEDVAIIMRAGSTNELSGGFGVDTVTVVSDAPGIKHDAQNKPLL